MKLLIVEDERHLATRLGSFFQQEGYVCEFADSYAMAEEKIDLHTYDIVLLDIGLPDGNGLELLDQLKQLHPDTGVLILTAKDALEDKVYGLDAGADDYVSKPFHMPELNARVKALIRRRLFHGQKCLQFREILIDPSTNVIRINEVEVPLNRKEYDLLLFFVTNPHRVLTKAAIAEHLWGDYMDLANNFNLVYSHVKNLRKTIAAAGGTDYIQTIYGMGYKFSDR